MSEKATLPSRVKSAILSNGSLCDASWYLAWLSGAEKAELDGEFTATELRAIADHMDVKDKQNPS